MKKIDLILIAVWLAAVAFVGRYAVELVGKLAGYSRQNQILYLGLP